MDSDKNMLRIVFFTIGVMVGAMTPHIVAFVTPNVPHRQLIQNICPRVPDGSVWCTGPGR